LKKKRKGNEKEKEKEKLKKKKKRIDYLKLYTFVEYDFSQNASSELIPSSSSPNVVDNDIEIILNENKMNLEGMLSSRNIFGKIASKYEISFEGDENAFVDEEKDSFESEHVDEVIDNQTTYNHNNFNHSPSNQPSSSSVYINPQNQFETLLIRCKKKMQQLENRTLTKEEEAVLS
jgi:hypothetical protein